MYKEQEEETDSQAPLNHNLCDVVEPEIHGDMVAGNGLLIKVRDFITREHIRRAEKGTKKRGLHFFFTSLAVLAHVVFLGCVPVLIWLILTRYKYKCVPNTKDYYVCNFNYHVWFTAPVATTASVIGISYIYILVESGLSRTWKYIKNRRLCSFAQEYVHRRRHRLPDIYVQANCFHFETDRNLNSRQVITFSEKVRFPYMQCIDVSGDLHLPELCPDRPTKVELQYIFGFVDRETEQKFKYFKTALVEKHTAKDRNIEILELIEMEGIEQKLCVISQTGSPHWTHPAYYWLSSTTLFTFLYRYLFIKRTDNKLYLYIKLIKS